MTVKRLNRFTHIALIAIALTSLLGATACGGKDKKADRAPTEKRVLQSKTPEPTADILKDSPCGNPDWAKPPGSQGEEAVDQDFRATIREKAATKTPADKPTKENEEAQQDQHSDEDTTQADN